MFWYELLEENKKYDTGSMNKARYNGLVEQAKQSLNDLIQFAEESNAEDLPAIKEITELYNKIRFENK